MWNIGISVVEWNGEICWVFYIIKKFQSDLNGKFYRGVVRPTILYGLECWAVDRGIEQIMSVKEMRMLRCMSGVTK